MPSGHLRLTCFAPLRLGRGTNSFTLTIGTNVLRSQRTPCYILLVNSQVPRIPSPGGGLGRGLYFHTLKLLSSLSFIPYVTQ